jgi:hypothetical protein
MLKQTVGPKRDEVTGGWRNCITNSFMVCNLRQVWLELSSQGGWVGRGIQHELG